MNDHNDFINELGLLALGSRLRRLSDRIMASGMEIYSSREIDFEPRWFVLYRLLASRGPLTVGACARALGQTHAAVSQTVRAMSEQGIAVSHRDPKDERRRLLELTDQGRALAPKMAEVWDDIEGSVQDLVSYGGVDILAAIEGIEQALDVASLDKRVANRQSARQMDTVEIIDFQPEYRDNFRTLNLEWLEKYFVVEPVDHEVLENPEGILKDGGAVLFARFDDQIVGTCALQKQGDEWELTKMAVTETLRGRKIGKTLALAAIERARTLGAKALFLVTNSSLTPAVTLYRTLGFRVTHCGQHPKYERGDLTMEMDLK